MQKLGAALQASPGVRFVMNVVGFDILSSGAKSNAGVIFAGLEEWSKRTGKDLGINAQIGRAFGMGAQIVPGSSP